MLGPPGHLAAYDHLKIAELESVSPVREHVAGRSGERPNQHCELLQQYGDVLLIEFIGEADAACVNAELSRDRTGSDGMSIDQRLSLIEAEQLLGEHADARVEIGIAGDSYSRHCSGPITSATAAS